MFMISRISSARILVVFSAMVLVGFATGGADAAVILRGALDATGGVADPVRVAVASTVQPVVIPAHPARTALLLMHVFALAIGMGSAFFIDFRLARCLYRLPVKAADTSVAAFGGQLVNIGLALLWISGLGFLAFYWHFAPEALMNQKVWTKVAVVGLLTLNGVAIHRTIIPRLSRSEGRRILGDLDLASAAPMIAVASVSVASWLFALVLGLVKELNFTWTFGELTSAYALIVLGIFASGCVVHGFLMNDRQPRRYHAAVRHG